MDHDIFKIKRCSHCSTHKSEFKKYHTLMLPTTVYFVHMNYHNNFEVSHSNEKSMNASKLNKIRLSNSI
ncbi:hypothetical protein KFK09_002966 [Dendrobium nobile]|uniref:Uncharacterized protein n=1 Tax=Dendrobium nobile TaxID=94219 RepID=A0A8T3C8P7_DENNO|nr:hypothetical protein KFK09_002966 [Dendrobium nobile]